MYAPSSLEIGAKGSQGPVGPTEGEALRAAGATIASSGADQVAGPSSSSGVWAQGLLGQASPSTSLRYTNISGKNVMMQRTPRFSTWIVGDSHVKRMSAFFLAKQANSASISGGLVDHAESLLLENDYFGTDLKCLFLLCGGNDIAINMPIFMIANKVARVVKKVMERNADCVVITGTVVSRYHRHGFRQSFIKQQLQLDKEIKQQGDKHHHYLTDIMTREPREKYGPLAPRNELMCADGVHLNNAGREVYAEVLEFVFEGVKKGRFEGRHDMTMGADRRSVLWKF